MERKAVPAEAGRATAWGLPPGGSLQDNHSCFLSRALECLNATLYMQNAIWHAPPRASHACASEGSGPYPGSNRTFMIGICRQTAPAGCKQGAFDVENRET